MGNVFNISGLGSVIATAKDKAVAFAGTYGLNEIIGGRVLPPLPPFPKGEAQEIAAPAVFDEAYSIETGESSEEIRYSIFGSPMCFPLAIKKSDDSEWWWLPIEPIITLGGGNVLVRRNVAKVSSKKQNRRGSIKETFALDDCKIEINGLLSRFDEWQYPTDDVRKLREIIESRRAIDVKCELFEIFGIGKMVVENWDFPFTKGEENQAYRISGFSDDDWELLIKK